MRLKSAQNSAVKAVVKHLNTIITINTFMLVPK